MSNLFYIDKPLRYGMVGGGATSQMGNSYHDAFHIDSYSQLVAGDFDIDAGPALNCINHTSLILI